MDIRSVVNAISAVADLPEEKIHWGSAYSAWEVCRHKVIGIPVLDLLVSQVRDPELKRLIQEGTELNAIPHAKELQNFLHEHDLTYPPLPARNAIDDEQIARALKEIIRLALNHEVHAFMSTTRDSERDLFWSILSDDRKSFDAIINLSRKKGWLLNPPNLITNN